MYLRIFVSSYLGDLSRQISFNVSSYLRILVSLGLELAGFPQCIFVSSYLCIFVSLRFELAGFPLEGGVRMDVNWSFKSKAINSKSLKDAQLGYTSHQTALV